MLCRASRKPRVLPTSFIQPCVASESAKVPSGPGWVHEIKHDGYRMLVRKSGDRVRLFTRNGFDWTERYPWVVEAARGLRAKDCVIDREIVVAGKDGVSGFEKLHSRCIDQHAFFKSFDLLIQGRAV
jgi:bifunctional non-homologous end joining protein LigD